MKTMTSEEVFSGPIQIMPFSPEFRKDKSLRYTLMDFHAKVGIRGQSMAHQTYKIDEHMRNKLGCHAINLGDHSRVLLTEVGTLYVMQPYQGSLRKWCEDLAKIAVYCKIHEIWFYSGPSWYHHEARTIAVDYHAYLRAISEDNKWEIKMAKANLKSWRAAGRPDCLTCAHDKRRGCELQPLGICDYYQIAKRIDP